MVAQSLTCGPQKPPMVTLKPTSGSLTRQTLQTTQNASEAKPLLQQNSQSSVYDHAKTVERNPDQQSPPRNRAEADHEPLCF